MPKKFEGEPEYAAHFYNMALQGMQDDVYISDEYNQVDYFRANKDDIDAIANDVDRAALKAMPHILLYETDDGFVYTKVFLTKAAAERYASSVLGVD